MELNLEHFYIFPSWFIVISFASVFKDIFTQFSDVLVKTSVNSSANVYLVRYVYRDVEDYIFFILFLKIVKVEFFN